MILECIPNRNTEVGKQMVERLDHLNKINPVNNIDFLKGRIMRTSRIIEKRLKENEIRNTI
jgi:hypothetical protein